MGRQIIKQPNDLWAIYSTIVDDFILMNATLEDIIKFELNEAEERIRRRIIMATKNKFPRTTFEEALENIHCVHGKLICARRIDETKLKKKPHFPQAD